MKEITDVRKPVVLDDRFILQVSLNLTALVQGLPEF
jgi:hypothetical protein